MSLEIIGAGFGRTGTLSLKLALEQLGFGPCYHMMEVFRRPGDAETWEAAARGEATDWRAFLREFRSAVDWPACYFWRELWAVYPQARIILTERDPESWYRSISSTIFEFMQKGDPSTIDDPLRRAQMKMGQYIVGERTFGNDIGREHVLDVYRRNSDEVRRLVPQEKLLVYDAREGWEPLCRFLGVPVPGTPYPKTNSTEEFRNRATTRVATTDT
ncbi:MAG TPA: sulfotransferase [Rhizomicrobium sp.]|jgi:hypothetical protein|nr:sulfotransferase [Rhizomicrobium sp.]